jgi:hypothetical protein
MKSQARDDRRSRSSRSWPGLAFLAPCWRLARTTTSSRPQRAELLADPALGVAELRRRGNVGLVVLVVVFAVGFAAGCVSLRGIRANDALVILPEP